MGNNLISNIIIAALVVVISSLILAAAAIFRLVKTCRHDSLKSTATKNTLKCERCGKNIEL